ncbi:MAG: hypothetical protein E6G06_03235 [Actinobacteria bacterium]|nr:MAG: hypothetical protein E6G06_03235 [Actinomycetota bacterium]
MSFLRRSACTAAVVTLIAATACSGDDKAAPASTSVERPQVPGERDRVVVRGSATVDGAPFDSRWVGAVVLRGGLVTPCQTTLPPVANGRYSVTVFAETESSGCGGPGARIVLWTYADNKIVFSTNALAWPGNGRVKSFAARYSTSAPAGAAPVTAQFTGGVFRADGVELPPGTRVEAYVGDTRCGVASVRSSESFTGYVLSVVGPDSIAGCTRGATLAFRIDGRPAAATTVVNTPPGQREALDLTLP